MADKQKPYSVGRLRNPRPEDRRFDSRRDAIAVAFDSAKDLDVWAVWFEDDAVAVIYDGQMFT